MLACLRSWWHPPPKKLALPIYAEGHYCYCTSCNINTCTSNVVRNFDPNVKMLFQVKALEDIGGRGLDIDNTIHHKFDWTGLDMVGYG